MTRLNCQAGADSDPRFMVERLVDDLPAMVELQQGQVISEFEAFIEITDLGGRRIAGDVDLDDLHVESLAVIGRRANATDKLDEAGNGFAMAATSRFRRYTTMKNLIH